MDRRPPLRDLTRWVLPAIRRVLAALRPARPLAIGPVAADVEAPPALVYQMLAAIGQAPGESGERAEVLERNGNELVCDFWSRVSLPIGVDRLVRTRERVILRPPDRVEYEHLDGPVRGLRETIDVEASGGGSRLVYRGRYEPRSAVDGLRARLLAGPAIRRVMDEHFRDLAGRAEARAARSRVFPRPAGTEIERPAT